MSNYYHKSIFDLYISKSNITNSGLGVFTKTYIPKDSLIDEYFGTYTTSLPGGEYFFRINEEGGINAINLPRCYMGMLNDAAYRPTSKRGLRRFTEHSFTNNCYFKVDVDNNKVKVYSLIDIELFSELFISYGKDYWL
jgi:hypothetical protein